MLDSTNDMVQTTCLNMDFELVVLKMWLVGHQWLVDGGESSLTLCCVYFPTPQSGSI